MKNKQNNFNLLLRIFALAFLFLLTLSSVLSCSFNTDKASIDPVKLEILESKISALQSDRFYIESEYMNNINALESKIDKLEAQIPPPSPTKTETETESPSESQYFGFGYRIENDKITITSYNGSATELIIPASIGGLPVVSIGDNAFENSSLTSVSVPETLKSIGWFAFSGSYGLKRIIIPKNVIDIGYNAFAGTKDLTVYAPPGSHAYQYAKSYGIKVAEE